ncbi:TetR/AcrR family transcriptional regulator [Rhodococcus opacus]|uniref:TetR/AcrR family transcriptional regulator n=1 Tax=Rhodococcus opacus TaxID=37919 RepID=UPI001FF6F7D4|nr:TetR/AcrR family transcriptional regulator [Rhodococcus opacus]UOT05570.1 TetR/AcrR family transcriptional regulator [Rhodococcus opacus]
MNDTKARILGTSSDLFRRNGYTGTGLKQVAAEARAPFGSIYHFFPGGKQQLGEEVIRSSGEEYARLVFSILDAYPDILEGIEVGFQLAGETLVATDYADACPIATVALEVASTNEVLRVATADVFTSWIDSGSALLRARGFAETDARRLILGFVTSLEGAFVLARALRSTEPLDAAGATVLAAARACLPSRE